MCSTHQICSSRLATVHELSCAQSHTCTHTHTHTHAHMHTHTWLFMIYLLLLQINIFYTQFIWFHRYFYTCPRLFFIKFMNSNKFFPKGSNIFVVQCPKATHHYIFTLFQIQWHIVQILWKMNRKEVERHAISK